MNMKRQPIVNGQRKPGRNEPCPCESGLKFKDCHGSEKFRKVCTAAANEAAIRTMLMLIQQMQAQKGICPKCKKRFVNRRCDACGIDFLTPEEAQQRVDDEKAKQRGSLVLPDKKIILPGA